MRPFPRINTLFAPSVALLASITLLSQSLLANDWPQWRGADRSDRSPETGLLKSWPEGGPKRVWLTQNAGIGYSGFAVAKRRVYTLSARGQQEFLIALSAKDGKEVWSSKNFGKGAVTYADGMLYCVDESSGAVALVEASPKGWNEHSRFKLEPQTTLRKPEGLIWTHPVISNGRLYLRDQDLIYCFDVKGK